MDTTDPEIKIQRESLERGEILVDVNKYEVFCSLCEAFV
jgi:hypothetical protein